MVLETFMGGGPILLGVLIALTNALKWPTWLHYVWAAISLIFGIVVYVVL